MNEVKEFRYPDKNKSWPDWVYRVLRVENQGFKKHEVSVSYVINADQPLDSFCVAPDEVDRYIDIFNWIKQRETVNND